jgi:hypothetical protein
VVRQNGFNPGIGCGLVFKIDQYNIVFHRHEAVLHPKGFNMGAYISMFSRFCKGASAVGGNRDLENFPD